MHLHSIELNFSVIVFCMLCLLIAVVHGYVGTNVNTPLGTFVGVAKRAEFSGEYKNYREFLGIPYAKPPIGEGRFARPQELKTPFGTPYNATFHRPQCVQIKDRFNFKYMRNATTSEDCLYLNVYVPEHETPKGNLFPVMVYIHGGSLSVGGSNIYTGETLSAFYDVIVVSINYRLNVFGFLTDGSKYSGNFGLWDMTVAIEWIHKYIVHFGGDVDRVTLFGNSAGSMAIELLALFANNSNSFHRIITQSGSALAYYAIEQGDIKSKFYDYAKLAGCDGHSSGSVLDCLRRKPIERLKVLGMNYFPLVDDDFVTLDTSKLINDKINLPFANIDQFLKLDLMSGLTSKEAGVFTELLCAMNGSDVEENGLSRDYFVSNFVPGFQRRIDKECPVSDVVTKAIVHEYTDWSNPNDPFTNRDKCVEIAGDTLFTYPSAAVMKLHTLVRRNGKGGNTFFYVFHHMPEYVSKHRWLKGAVHSAELPYLFGLPKSFERRLVEDFWASDPLIYTDEDWKLSRTMMRLWTNFAKTGDPNFPRKESSHNFPTWPQYDDESQRYLEISANITSHSVKHHYAASRVALWTELIPAIRRQQQCSVRNGTSVKSSGVNTCKTSKPEVCLCVVIVNVYLLMKDIVYV